MENPPVDSNGSNDISPRGVLVPTEPAPWFRQEHYLLDREKTIVGRAPECQIRINHPNVSRTHLSLEWVGGSFIASYLSSSNVTYINGVPLADTCALRNGDRIELAEGVQFRFELFDVNDDAPTEHRPFGEHLLLAIVHTDVASYSRLMEDNAEGTARQFAVCLDIVKAEIASVGGRIDNVAGDSLLIVFKSTHSAVVSTMNWQKRIASLNQTLPPKRRMQFRAGINLGDVFISSAGALHGEAINIAERLQRLAAPESVVVAGVVRDQLHGHEQFIFDYLGSPELKNISREIRAYRVQPRAEG
jgi:class 3 adenylate cyclase